MSTGVTLARILAALTVTAAPGAAFVGSSPVISTGDAAAVAPGQVENTGGNVVIGDAAPMGSPPPGTTNSPPALPPIQPRAHVAPHASADAAVAKAHKTAADARARALALAEEARRQAAEAVARANARADEARQRGQQQSQQGYEQGQQAQQRSQSAGNRNPD